MKFYTKTLILAILSIGVFCLPMLSFAQNWSAEQKAVWKVIETHWRYLAQENKEKFLENFHSAFKGFVNWRTLPLDKENLGKWIEYMHKTTDISIYTVEPVAITIHGDIAVVQYYCDLSFAVPPGKQVRSSFRYTDILKKEKNKWLVIAAHKEKMQ